MATVTREKTIDEMVEYILEHDGPGPGGRAHPDRRVNYQDLVKALERIYERKELLELKVYHFSDVRSLWVREGAPSDEAREVIGRLIEYYISVGKYKDFNDAIVNFCKEDFLTNLLQDEISTTTFTINTSSMMAKAYHDSPTRAILDYVHHSLELGRKFVMLGPEHFGRAPQNNWIDKKGKPTDKARDVIGRVIDHYIRTGRYRDFGELVENITGEDFRSNPVVDQINGGKFSVNSSGALRYAYNNSFCQAILDYVSHNPQLSNKYVGLDQIHFRNTKQVWTKEGRPTEKARQVVGKLISHYLRVGKFTDLNDLIMNITFDDFLSNSLQESIGGHAFTINTTTLIAAYDNCPSAVILDYIRHHPQLRQKYSKLGPEHFGRAPQNTWIDKKGKPTDKAREVVGRVLNHYIGIGKFKDLDDAIKNIRGEDFQRNPLSDEINNGRFPISSISVYSNAYGGFVSAAVLDYIRHHPQLRQKYSKLGPEHFGRAPQNTWIDKKGKPTDKAREITGKLLNHFIATNEYHDLNEAIREICQDNFTCNPLQEKIGDTTFTINTQSMLANAYNNSPSVAVLDYIHHSSELKEKYARLGPEHFLLAPRNTWTDQKGRSTDKAREVVGRLVEYYISTGRFTDLNDMIRNIRQCDLRINPLCDEIAGARFEINSRSAIDRAYKGSPSSMILDQIRHNPTLRDKYEGLGPEHFSYVLYTWTNKKGKPTAKAREITRKVIEFYISQGVFTGFDDMLRKIQSSHFLVNPIVENIGGADFQINSTSMFVNAYGSRVSAAVLDYTNHSTRLKRKYSWLTPAHFIGSIATRERKLTGEFSWLELKKMKQPDGTYDTSVFGLPQFSSDDKLAVREIMVEEALDILLDRDIHYLGLETEQFKSLRKIHEYLNFSPKGSTIIERDRRVYNAMKSMQGARANRRILGKVQIIPGSIEEKVYAIDGKYNFVNLDFQGHMSGDKEKAIRGLFENDLLEDQAVIYITLADSPRHKGWSNRAGYGRDQMGALHQVMEKQAENTYVVEKLFELPYKGGTGGKRRTPMFTVGYVVRKAA